MSLASITMSLSPLVIMNITDHYTRFRYIKESMDVQVIGVLLGKQEGRSVKLLQSFETKYDDEAKTIDKSYTQRRLESFAKIFPDFEIVGWYATCTKESDTEILDWEGSLNKQFEVFKDNPLFLKMNVSITKRKEMDRKGHSKKDMPITIYEKNQEKELVKCLYTIEPSEPERIALDDAKKDISSTKDRSQLSVNLTTTLNSIKLLRKNVSSLIEVVKNVPALKKNHDIMRQIASICNRLPLVSDTDDYNSELFIEYADTLLVSELGVLNKAIEQIQDFNSHKAAKNIEEIFS
jgi:COP9 signalosome complex subunit 6